MKRIVKKLLSVTLSALMLVSSYAPTIASAVQVTSEITNNHWKPKSYLYHSASGITTPSEDRKMISPGYTWGNGDVAYCIGGADQDPPYAGTIVNDNGVCNDMALVNLIAAGYPYTESQYGLFNNDYQYVTQMAIRVYKSVNHTYYADKVFSDGSEYGEKMLAEFRRIWNAQYKQSDPQTVFISVGGKLNKTTVSIGDTQYYRYGAFYPEVENGSLEGNYRVIIDGSSSAFHSYSATPSSSDNIVEDYLSSDVFYVFVPTTEASSIEISIEPREKEYAVADFTVITYLFSGGQDIARVTAEFYGNYEPIPRQLEAEPAPQVPPTDFSIYKVNPDGVSVKGISFDVSEATDASFSDIHTLGTFTIDTDGNTGFAYGGNFSVKEGNYYAVSERNVPDGVTAKTICFHYKNGFVWLQDSNLEYTIQTNYKNFIEVQYKSIC